MKDPEKFWDFLAKDFDKGEKRFEPIHIKTIENTRKHINDRKVVLDYGCATGMKTLEIAPYVNTIQGIDLSSKMIEFAKQRAAEKGITNADFAHATIYDEKWRNESFDVILAFNILHLLEDNPRIIHRIYQLLKFDGIFISLTPCVNEKMAFINKIEFSFFRMLSIIGLIPPVLNRFKFSDIDSLLNNGGMNIIETEKIYHKISSYFTVSQKIRITA